MTYVLTWIAGAMVGFMVGVFFMILCVTEIGP